MVNKHSIREFAEKIAARYSPEKIILFGSQARGTETEESDVDLLVIMDFDGRSIRKASEIRSSIDYHFPLDLLVRRASDISWRIQEGDYFLQDIMKEGVVLYEAAH
jgi:predicted nucleotidyltransferase